MALREHFLYIFSLFIVMISFRSPVICRSIFGKINIQRTRCNNLNLVFIKEIMLQERIGQPN